MEFYNKVKSQQDQPDQGELKVSVFTEDGADLLYRREWTDGGRSTYRFIRTDTDS